jgi:septal ring factor EnvC (AmiA/AmiB activator)
LEQKTKDQHQTIVKLEEKVKLLDESGSKYQQVILDSTARVKQLEGEIQRFSVLAETLKKKFRRKLELILSRIKSSVARLHD